MAIKWIATLLSVILPGSGQLINHHWLKGGVALFTALIISGMLSRGSVFTVQIESDSGAHLMFILALLGLAVWSAYDAFRNFKKEDASA